VASGVLSYHIGKWYSQLVAEDTKEAYRDGTTREELFRRLQVEVDSRNAQAAAPPSGQHTNPGTSEQRPGS